MISATSLLHTLAFLCPHRIRHRNSLDRDACLPDFLRSAARSEQTDARAVQPRRELEQVCLVVDREQRFRRISTWQCCKVVRAEAHRLVQTWRSEEKC